MENVGGSRTKRYSNKRKRDLASFVYNCIDEVYVGNKKGSCKYSTALVYANCKTLTYTFLEKSRLRYL